MRPPPKDSKDSFAFLPAVKVAGDLGALRESPESGNGTGAIPHETKPSARTGLGHRGSLGSARLMLDGHRALTLGTHVGASGSSPEGG